MKSKLLVGLLLIIAGVLAYSPLSAQNIPEYEPGELLKFTDGSTLYPAASQYYAVPAVADWNGNGKVDLVSGYFYEGWVYFYNNVGSSVQPAFVKGDEVKLQADGSTISVGYG